VAFVDCADEIGELGREGCLPEFAAVGIGEGDGEAEVANGSELGWVEMGERGRKEVCWRVVGYVLVLVVVCRRWSMRCRVREFGLGRRSRYQKSVLGNIYGFALVR